MKFNEDKFIQWLKRQSGNRLSFQEIENWQSLKKSTPQKSSKKKTYFLSPHLYSILSELELMKILYIGEDFIKLKKNFSLTGILSVARSGNAFVNIEAQKEIFVGKQNKADAHHRDSVEVEITGKSYNRYEGRICRVLKNFQKEMLAQVISVRSDGWLLQFFDLPDQPYGFLLRHHESKKKTPLYQDMLVVEKTSTNVSVALAQNSSNAENNSAPKKSQRQIKNIPCYTLKEILPPAPVSSQGDFKRVCLKYNLPSPYEKSAIPNARELKQLTKEGKKDPLRRNLLSLFACTIDGDSAKDFDDAISIEEHNDYFILYVHIADVSFYVKYGSPLDAQAAARSTSYYLQENVIPMLPAILSEDFCSLKPKTERLAFTCEMKILKTGEINQFNFYKSLIYLNKRYTYTTAQKELQTQPKSPLQTFWRLTQILMHRRNQNGRLNLEIPDLQIKYNRQRPVDVHEVKNLSSHKLIEECMLSANICASIFTRLNKIPSLYRVHESIPRENLSRVNHFLKLYSFSGQLKGSQQKEICALMQENQAHPQKKIFHFSLLRAFAQAYYHNEPKGHWGLAFDDYTHFTSPIRRYPDLVVHRQMANFISHQPYSYSPAQLEELGRQCSRQERIALDAERDMFKLAVLHILTPRSGEIFSATLSGFSAAGLYITLNSPPVEGFVPLPSFSDAHEVQSIDDFRVYLPKLQKSLTVGSHITVRLVQVDMHNMQSRFEIVSLG